MVHVEKREPLPQGCAHQDRAIHVTYVAKSGLVMLILAAAKSVERDLTDPLAVDNASDSDRYLAFLGDVHGCLQSHMARLPSTLALEEVVEPPGAVGSEDVQVAGFIPGIRIARSASQWRAPGGRS